jgi:hypothetical protein
MDKVNAVGSLCSKDPHCIERIPCPHHVERVGLRDYFAAKAMAALLANALDNEITFDGYASFEGMVAEQAYEQADAMLRARSTATGDSNDRRV